MTTSRRKGLPSIYIDEHVSPAVAAEFRVHGYRTVEIARAKLFKGRDEEDYIGELARHNGIFVTSDGDFVDNVYDNRKTHTGIVLIPSGLSLEVQLYVARAAAGYIMGATSQRSSTLHNTIMYADNDGFWTASYAGRKSALEMSWDSLALWPDSVGTAPRKSKHKRRLA